MPPALVSAFLRRLTKIESWFLRQSSLKFFASSVLLVYDAQAIALAISQHLNTKEELLLNNGEHVKSEERGDLVYDSSEYDECWFDRYIDVRMIDFAHVYRADSSSTSIDSNYLIGLRSLISYLTRLTSATYQHLPN